MPRSRSIGARWSGAVRAPPAPARATFAECASAWIERDTPETFSALLEAWRYAVFYVQVVKLGRAAPADTAAIVHASVGGCRLLLDLDGDTAYLTGNTERAAVEGWCAGGDYAPSWPSASPSSPSRGSTASSASCASMGTPHFRSGRHCGREVRRANRTRGPIVLHHSHRMG